MLRAFGGDSGEKGGAARRLEPGRPAVRTEGKGQSLKDSAPSRPPHVAATRPAMAAAPRPSPTPPVVRPVELADAPAARAVGVQQLDLNRMAERWDDIVAELRG